MGSHHNRQPRTTECPFVASLSLTFAVGVHLGARAPKRACRRTSTRCSNKSIQTLAFPSLRCRPSTTSSTRLFAESARRSALCSSKAKKRPLRLAKFKLQCDSPSRASSPNTLCRRVPKQSQSTIAVAAAAVVVVLSLVQLVPVFNFLWPSLKPCSRKNWVANELAKALRSILLPCL